MVLLAILPKEGNFVTLRIMRKLREGLSFSEEEIAQYKFKSEDGKMTWTANGTSKPIEIGTQAKILVQDALKALDKEQKLTEDHLSVYEKFVEKDKE